MFSDVMGPTLPVLTKRGAGEQSRMRGSVDGSTEGKASLKAGKGFVSAVYMAVASWRRDRDNLVKKRFKVMRLRSCCEFSLII